MSESRTRAANEHSAVLELPVPQGNDGHSKGSFSWQAAVHACGCVLRKRGE